jgi:uncharacterized protein (DUF2237 family)
MAARLPLQPLIDPSEPRPSQADPAAVDGAALNVLGDPLELCGCQPLTGWFRDGSCRTDPADHGRHTVCCVVNDAFLSYTRAQGNDLSSPSPAHGFPGLRPGDAWCVCAVRWLEAHEDGMAPPVRLEACEISTLEVIPLEVLRSCAA